MSGCQLVGSVEEAKSELSFFVKAIIVLFVIASGLWIGFAVILHNLSQIQVDSQKCVYLHQTSHEETTQTNQSAQTNQSTRSTRSAHYIPPSQRKICQLCFNMTKFVVTNETNVTITTTYCDLLYCIDGWHNNEKTKCYPLATHQHDYYNIYLVESDAVCAKNGDNCVGFSLCVSFGYVVSLGLLVLIPSAIYLAIYIKKHSDEDEQNFELPNVVNIDNT